jgi:3-hydroxyacyl-CoA dehydrogenase
MTSMLNTAQENVHWLAVWGRQERVLDQISIGRRKIGTVGIIGAGLMGTSIAAAHVQYRFPVVIHDINAETLDRAPAAIAAELRLAGSHIAAESFRRLVRPTADLSEAARCDLVLESIVEALPLKLQLYAQLQRHLQRETILASNTSTIPLGRLAAGLADASRFCGLHFCHPVQRRPLVEIVRGPLTDEIALAAAVAHARRIGRMPLVVRDGPGFVVNRLLFPYLGEALELLREGVSAASIERAAAEFGMSAGPLRFMDEIGLDTVLQAAWVLAGAFPERILTSPLLVSLVKAGRLGQKTGVGFFMYDGHTIANLPAAISGVGAGWPSESLAYRLILPMLLEATRILEEGMVGDARDIDLAALFGLGFPAAKGGLLWWADQLGAARIIEILETMPDMGPRAQPTPLLRRMADNGESFYPDRRNSTAIA